MNLEIRIAAVGDQTAFPECANCVDAPVYGVGILEKGTGLGKTAVGILGQLPDGSFVVVQMTASLFLSAAGAVRGACERFGDTASLK